MDGPFGGIVQSIAVAPSDPSVVYAGTRAGVFKSSDGGGHWAAVNNGLQSLPVNGVAVDPADPDVAYVAMNARNLYKTTDGGSTWSELGVYAYAIAISPAVPSHVFVAAGSYVWRSTDAGQTWEQVLDTAGGVIVGIVADPSSSDIVYALDELHAVYKTTDGGDSWHQLSLSDPASLTIDPASPSTLYAANTSGEMFESTDGGATWASLPGQLYRAWWVEDDPVAPSTVYAGGYDGTAGGCYVARSDDGGGTWAVIATPPGGLTCPSLVPDPSSASTVYATTFDHGVYKSTDAGNSFFESNTGLTAGQVTALAVDPTDPSVIYASLEAAGLFKSTDGGATWSALTTPLTAAAGPSEDVFIHALAVDATSPPTVYAAGATSNSADDLYKSTDGGANWSVAETGLPADMRIRSLQVDPRSPGTVLAAADNAPVTLDNHYEYYGAPAGLYETTDSGGAWSLIGPNDWAVVGLAVKPDLNAIAVTEWRRTSSGTISDSGVFLSTDWGHSWTETIQSDVAPAGPIAFGGSADDLFVGSGNGNWIGRSTDGGQSWQTRIIYGTSGLITQLAVDPVDHSEVYAGLFGDGMWISDDSGSNWRSLTPGVSDIYTTGPIVFAPTTAPSTNSAEQTSTTTLDLSVARPLYVGMGGRGRGGTWRIIPAPTHMRRPTIQGTPRPGRVLKSSVGRWTRASRYTFRWFRSGRAISGATHSRYLVRRSDRGHNVACRVTAYGPGGKAHVKSNAVRII